MSGKRKHLHTISIPVRWGDLDAIGHVNNSGYFTFCEQARAGWLDSLGATDTLAATSQGPVIVHAECSFIKPIGYPATVRVEMFGEAPGRSSFKSIYEIRDAETESRLYATASAQVVWVDRQLEKSLELPRVIRRLLPAEESAG